MDSSTFTTILLAFIPVAVTVVGVFKVRADNNTKALEIEKNAENARIKIETDAATVKTELETAAAKVKLELETAAALALAETEKQRETERATAARELEEFRAKQAKELEEYRAERARLTAQTASAMAVQATLQAEIAKQLASLIVGQKQATKAITGAGVAIGARIDTAEQLIGTKIDDAQSAIVEGIVDYRDFSILYWGMLVEDPPATRERLKRVRRAWDEGDMEKAQSIADEKGNHAGALGEQAMEAMQ